MIHTRKQLIWQNMDCLAWWLKVLFWCSQLWTESGFWHLCSSLTLVSLFTYFKPYLLYLRILGAKCLTWYLRRIGLNVQWLLMLSSVLSLKHVHTATEKKRGQWAQNQGWFFRGGNSETFEQLFGFATWAALESANCSAPEHNNFCLDRQNITRFNCPSIISAETWMKVWPVMEFGGI